jgi:hypothetical protein
MRSVLLGQLQPKVYSQNAFTSTQCTQHRDDQLILPYFPVATGFDFPSDVSLSVIPASLDFRPPRQHNPRNLTSMFG